MANIGDFAENLILNQVDSIKTGKSLPPELQEENKAIPAGIDISKTEVPNSFMKQILGEQFAPQEKPADSIPELVWNQEDTSNDLQPLTEETGQQLIPLLEQVKYLLEEVCSMGTSSGNLGVNLGANSKNTSYEAIEKKLGYQKSKPVTKKEAIKIAIKKIKK